MLVHLLFVLLSGALRTDAATPIPPRSQQSQPEANPERRYWIDPSNGLMWAGKDNGKDVSWKTAVKYCSTLRLASYSDWKLATLPQLESIYDKNVEAPGLDGSPKRSPFTWHVKGSLFLTGDQWSSEQRLDDRGKSSGYVWYFDFNEGRSNNDPVGWPYSYKGMRALCVRMDPALLKPSKGAETIVLKNL